MGVKLIFASDSFKGSLSQQTIIDILERTAHKVFDKPTCLSLYVSDGGEGALDSIISAKNGCYYTATVCNPLFEKIEARYGAFNDTAVISMSEASGLTVIPMEKRNPLYTTTYGTGELIKNAIDKGYKKIVITIGGSATNDGGLGALIALGAKVYLTDASLAKGQGIELEKVAKLDLEPLSKYNDIEFTVLSDVKNPLTGETGATRIFSKQKGATPEIMDRLEKGMLIYEKVMFETLNQNQKSIEGGGAAGGLGFGLVMGLKAKITSGIEYILDLNDYDAKLDGATCVITGEGRIDGQTAFGKVISGIIDRAKNKNVPVFAIVGSVGEGAESLYNLGLTGIYSIINKPANLQEILDNSKGLYYATALSLFNTIKGLMK